MDRIVCFESVEGRDHALDWDHGGAGVSLFEGFLPVRVTPAGPKAVRVSNVPSGATNAEVGEKFEVRGGNIFSWLCDGVLWTNRAHVAQRCGTIEKISLAKATKELDGMDRIVCFESVEGRDYALDWDHGAGVSLFEGFLPVRVTPAGAQSVRVSDVPETASDADVRKIFEVSSRGRVRTMLSAVH